jgi:hypothetical protein
VNSLAIRRLREIVITLRDIPSYATGDDLYRADPEAKELVREAIELFGGNLRSDSILRSIPGGPFVLVGHRSSWADEIEAELPKEDSGCWSKPDSPKVWAKVFGVSADSLARLFDSQEIRNKRFSSKSYRVHVDDLPKS